MLQFDTTSVWHNMSRTRVCSACIGLVMNYPHCFRRVFTQPMIVDFSTIGNNLRYVICTSVCSECNGQSLTLILVIQLLIIYSIHPICFIVCECSSKVIGGETNTLNMYLTLNTNVFTMKRLRDKPF